MSRLSVPQHCWTHIRAPSTRPSGQRCHQIICQQPVLSRELQKRSMRSDHKRRLLPSDSGLRCLEAAMHACTQVGTATSVDGDRSPAADHALLLAVIVRRFLCPQAMRTQRRSRTLQPWRHGTLTLRPMCACGQRAGDTSHCRDAPLCTLQ